MNIMEKLAHFITELKLGDVDGPTVQQMKLSFADSLGCMIYRSKSEHVVKAKRAYRPMALENGSHIFFESWKLPAPLASFINGSMIGSMAYDDLHHGATVHCGCIAILAAYAACNMTSQPVSGADFLSALVTGYETMIRVALAVMPEVRRKGYHPASVAAPFAAAASASKILGLNESQTLNAIGIAGDFGSGLMSAQLSSNIHGMQAPYSSQHGVNGAIMAREGLLGIKEIFDDIYGSFLTTLSGKYDPKPIASIGDGNFLGKNIGIKFYPTAGSVSSALDGVREIMSANRIDPKDVEQITVKVNKSVFLHCGFDYTPGAVSGAQMHISYCIAALLVYGQVGAAQFEAKTILDPHIAEAMKLVKVVHDPTMDNLGPNMGYCARLSLIANGKEYDCEIINPKGSANNPLSESEVREKFMAQCEGIIAQNLADKIFNQAMNLERMSNIREFEQLIG